MTTQQEGQQPQQQQETTTTSPATAAAAADSSSSSPTPTKQQQQKKQVISPLIESRHEWYNEKVKDHKRQSIRDEDIPRSLAQTLADADVVAAADASSSPTSSSSGGGGGVIAGVSSAAGNNNNNNTGNDGKEEERTSIYISDDDDDDDDDDDNKVDNNNNNNNPFKLLSNQSMDISIESLDVPHRECLGDARRHKHHSIVLQRLGSDSTMQVDNTTTTTAAGAATTTSTNTTNQQQQQQQQRQQRQQNKNNKNKKDESEGKFPQLPPLAKIQVADSEFLGYAKCGLRHVSQIREFIQQIKLEHPTASHIPYAYDIVMSSDESDCNNNSNNNNNQYNEDGEPVNSTIGPLLLDEINACRKHLREGKWLFPEESYVYGSSDNNNATTSTTKDPRNSGICVVIVRYFGNQYLLGVTCGRLSQCYQRIAQLTLHRLFRGCHIPLQLDFTTTTSSTSTSIAKNEGEGGEEEQQQQQQKLLLHHLPGTPKGNIYGLAGGDTELHLNVLQLVNGGSSDHGGSSSQGEGDDDGNNNKHLLMKQLLNELDFDGFKGAKGEVLPRLQNLQSDFYRYDEKTHSQIKVVVHNDHDHDHYEQPDNKPSTTEPTPKVDDEVDDDNNNKGTIIPIYRYPGNYHGDEWETYPWSSTSLRIKQQVEKSLPHYYGNQKMNHCVTNFYRHGDDYIAHHSDKDLDLDRDGAIVSISIGSERILELRRRAEPRDITRLLLPHGSMLVLGPITNQQFTHSILPATTTTTTTVSAEEEETSLLLRRPSLSKRRRSIDNDATTTTTTTTTAITTRGGGNSSSSSSWNVDELLDMDARISLTLRNVTTYMDTKTKRLFGQGVEIPTLHELRRAERWDNLYFVLGFSAMQQVVRNVVAASRDNNIVNKLLVSSSSSALLMKAMGRLPTTTTSATGSTTTTTMMTNKRDSNTTTLKSVAQESVVVLGSAAVAWFSYTRLRKLYLHRKEERAARRFFTSKSTSGTKY